MLQIKSRILGGCNSYSKFDKLYTYTSHLNKREKITRISLQTFLGVKIYKHFQTRDNWRHFISQKCLCAEEKKKQNKKKSISLGCILFLSHFHFFIVFKRNENSVLKIIYFVFNTNFCYYCLFIFPEHLKLKSLSRCYEEKKNGKEFDIKIWRKVKNKKTEMYRMKEAPPG